LRDARLIPRRALTEADWTLDAVNGRANVHDQGRERLDLGSRVGYQARFAAWFDVAGFYSHTRAKYGDFRLPAAHVRRRVPQGILSHAQPRSSLQRHPQMNTEDIVAIQQLMTLYGHYMDQNRSKRYRSIGRRLRFSDLFVDEIEFRFGDMVLRGRKEFETMAKEREDADLPDDDTAPIVAHYVTNVYVYEADGQTRVHAKWFVPQHPHGGVGTGDYHKVVVKTPDGWRIASVDARVRSFPSERPATPV
jgi:hypothetical protein